MKQPKHPEIKVRLTGIDGNAFVIIGQVDAALRRHRIPESEINEFFSEAIRSDYDNLLQTCMRWVDVD